MEVQYVEGGFKGRGDSTSAARSWIRCPVRRHGDLGRCFTLLQVTFQESVLAKIVFCSSCKSVLSVSHINITGVPGQDFFLSAPFRAEIACISFSTHKDSRISSIFRTHIFAFRGPTSQEGMRGRRTPFRRCWVLSSAVKYSKAVRFFKK